jgi:hypothetical protein
MTLTLQPGPGRVDAGGTTLRLRALQVMGHGAAAVARAVGASERMIQRIARGDAQTVSPVLRDGVAAIYDRWWDKQAPAHTAPERAAASAARRRARRGDWCAGAALDDDQLDQPGYQPAHGWRPARGTGTASPTGAAARAAPRTGAPHTAPGHAPAPPSERTRPA